MHWWPIIVFLVLIALNELRRAGDRISNTQKSPPKDRETIYYRELMPNKYGRSFLEVTKRQLIIVPKNSLFFHSKFTERRQVEHIMECARVYGVKCRIKYERSDRRYLIWWE